MTIYMIQVNMLILILEAKKRDIANTYRYPLRQGTHPDGFTKYCSNISRPDSPEKRMLLSLLLTF